MAEKRTPFASVYNRFLEKVTDDMYIEFTVQDTIKDLQNLLVDAIPGFEFPRKNLYDYEIKTEIIREDKVLPSDFVIGVIWNELPEDNEIQIPDVIVERSSFAANLTLEEINILSIYMVVEWMGYQLASVENVRMKYTGSDFKMTSQANHMAKILSIQKDYERKGFHLQRLYKRRKVDDNGNIVSTFGSIMEKSTFDGR